MAAVASRSSLVGALLRNAIPVKRQLVFDFLRGLSRDELECIAEFQGACVLEACVNEDEYPTACHPYRLMSEFFEPVDGDRWGNPDHRAHKMFIVLAYLDLLEPAVSVRFQAKAFQ